MNQKSPTENGKYNPSTSQGSGKNLVDEAKEGLQGVARELKGEIGHVARDFAEEAKNAAETKAGAGKDFAAEQLGSVADALRRTSKHLRTNESPATEYVEKAAATVEGLSQYFQTRTLSQLVNDVERYARREPAIFLGGAFFAGMLGGRFLKAAAPASHGNGARAVQSSGEAARSLPAHDRDAKRPQESSTGSSPNARERQGRAGGNMQGQGQEKTESNTSVSADAPFASKTVTSTGATGNTTTGSNTTNKSEANKSDEAVNRGGKGSGVS